MKREEKLDVHMTTEILMLREMPNLTVSVGKKEDHTKKDPAKIDLIDKRDPLDRTIDKAEMTLDSTSLSTTGLRDKADTEQKLLVN